MGAIRALALAGALQCLVAAAALFVIGRRGGRAAYLLALLVLGIGATIASDFMPDGNEAAAVAGLCFHPLVAILGGPVAYLYAKSFARGPSGGPAGRGADGLAAAGATGTGRPSHGLPAEMPAPAIAATAVLLLAFAATALPRLRAYERLVQAASIADMLVFLALACREYAFLRGRAAQSSFGGFVSERIDAAQRASLRWLRFFLIFLAVLAIASGVLFFFPSIFDVLWPAASFLAIGVGFLSMISPESLARPPAPRGKYLKSALGPEEVAKGRDALEELFARENAHLDAEASLGSFAARLSIPAHQLSQVVNQAYGMSLRELLRERRVDAARGILGSPEGAGRKIIDVCHEAGFETLSAFNAAFKAATGLSPSEYRRKMMAGGQAGAGVRARSQSTIRVAKLSGGSSTE